MTKYAIVLVLGVIVAFGCAAQSPVAVEPTPPLAQAIAPDSGPYRLLYGEWTWLIPATHDRVEVVPRRLARFHLNAMKFLESYCTDCLTITGIKNNGDSTIDLTVKITHPFPGYPEYTGFDVKGIIMFNGSWVHEGENEFPPWPDPLRVSWRKLGDPQVLNADGYTIRWSPSYDSGSPLPIFNYWPGKYSNGTPNANVNAYLDFYTDENRHMFTSYGQVERTYKIWLPPGQPVVAGYAVEACWEPPLKTPVTDPASDFPLTANQVEAYEFWVNVNDGQPLTIPDHCYGDLYDPSEAYIFSRQWGGHTALDFAQFYSDGKENPGCYWYPCGDEWPDMYCYYLACTDDGNGDYLTVMINYIVVLGSPPWYSAEWAYTIYEFTVDLE